MFPVAIVHWSGINQILRLSYYIKPTQRTCLQLSHFWGEKIETVDLSGSHWTGEDAGAGREEPQQHRGQPLAETGDRGIRIQSREHCEYPLPELYTFNLKWLHVINCNYNRTDSVVLSIVCTFDIGDIWKVRSVLPVNCWYVANYLRETPGTWPGTGTDILDPREAKMIPIV